MNTNIEQPNYYAIIPANVRYDKNLPASAKLLYGEITALCNEKGVCWAKNEYFASLYGVSKKSITNWISILVQNGYISSDIVYKENTNEIENRYLSISNKPIERKTDTPMEKNFHTPMEKKFSVNNTILNNIYNNTSNNNIVDSRIDYDDFFSTLWVLYPRKEGKSAVSKSQKKKLYKIGYDEMSRAIERYKKSVSGRDKKYILMGSTFFNTRYADFLDDNYENTDENFFGSRVETKVDGVEDVWQ